MFFERCEDMKFLWIVFALVLCGKNVTAITQGPTETANTQLSTISAIPNQNIKEATPQRSLTTQVYAFILNCIQYVLHLWSFLKAKISHLV